jgi:hypothetical protein
MPARPGRENETLDYFTELGRRLEQRWASLDRDEERFPELAVRELERMPPDSNLPEQVAAALLDSRQPATRQLAPVGAFGQPGITQFFGRGFVIDVYFWNNAVPAIHNHPFCGCFTLVRGNSLHDVYTFDFRERLGTGMLAGDVSPQGLTLLQQGSIVPFSLHTFPLIHSLVHVLNPSVSLVIRTVRTLDYFQYFPPSLALSMSDADDLVERQLRLLRWMQAAAHPDYLSRLRAFLDSADFETTFRLVSASYGTEEVGQMIELARRRHGDRAELILPAIEGAVRLQQDNRFREQLEAGDERMVASILMCARNRSDVFRLLEQAFPDEEPSAVLGRFDVFDEDDPATIDAYRRLVAGDERNPEWRETIFRALLAQ